MNPPLTLADQLGSAYLFDWQVPAADSGQITLDGDNVLQVNDLGPLARHMTYDESFAPAYVPMKYSADGGPNDQPYVYADQLIATASNYVGGADISEIHGQRVAFYVVANMSGPAEDIGTTVAVYETPSSSFPFYLYGYGEGGARSNQVYLDMNGLDEAGYEERQLGVTTGSWLLYTGTYLESGSVAGVGSRVVRGFDGAGPVFAPGATIDWGYNVGAPGSGIARTIVIAIDENFEANDALVRAYLTELYALEEPAADTMFPAITWTERSVPALPTSGWQDVVAIDDDVLVAVGYSAPSTGKIVRSVDGGETWTEITGAAVAAHGWYAVVQSPTTGRLIAAGSGGALVSDDLGLTWAARSIPIDVVQDMVALDNGALIGVGKDDVGGPLHDALINSTDNGETWTQRTPQTADSFQDSCVMTDGVNAVVSAAYAPGDGGGGLSTDSGATWADVTFPGQDAGMWMNPGAQYTAAHGYLAHGYTDDAFEGIWQSDDGVTWTFTPIVDIGVDDPNSGDSAALWVERAENPFYLLRTASEAGDYNYSALASYDLETWLPDGREGESFSLSAYGAVYLPGRDRIVMVGSGGIGGAIVTGDLG